ncbi:MULTISPECIES: hypothetical protein [unclassified Akkermansia]|jgi:hypothetical protein|uniref:hypothetical protein n=1 Tax=unclassified Akkermansia TaxID=2608915 RepID=UPI0025EDACEF|nr:hypothetical protein [Akkermansia sp.]MEE0764759.1 hypothetical protein [Akkermansia sp.]
MLNKVEISGRKPWTEPWSGGAKRGIEVQKGVAGMIGPTGEGRGRETVHFRFFTFSDGKTEDFRKKPLPSLTFPFPDWQDFI